ncbi:hypothetical protein OS493_004584 [Desmophyllum pertusum]|uniref:TGF-beta family profile domain-containing protein n=1 Tax=Desmophyllum pertusum TaxID=174260 RepID=A0A9W9ZGE1_9CNID|nr:hypothetical protein OS493_004584 [Desmophyllum pertusum]
MTMLYLLLSLLASQLFLVSPSLIGKEQVENRQEPSPSSVVNRTASESDGPKTPPYLLKIYQNVIIKGHKAHGEAPSFQSFQAKSPAIHTEVEIKGSSPDTTKRHTPPAKVEEEVDGCQKEDMIVHTADLGLFAKVIKPESFNAFQCKGRCSLTQRKKFINHSLLKAIVKKKKGIKTEGEACCVPTKLRPKYFLFYIENRGYVIRTFKDMIVEDCGCY